MVYSSECEGLALTRDDMNLATKENYGERRKINYSERGTERLLVPLRPRKRAKNHGSKRSITDLNRAPGSAQNAIFSEKTRKTWQ
jgi:hypothetical protein